MTSRIRLCCILLSAIYLTAAPTEAAATAEDIDNWRSDAFEVDDPWEEPAVQSHPGWYGMQTLGTSLGSILVFGLGIGIDFLPLSVAGAIGYYLGPTMIHLLHNRTDAAIGSFLAHLSAPVLGGAVFFTGYFFERNPDGSHPKSIMAGLGTFVVLGVAALVLDTAVLANPAPDAWAAVPQLNYDGDRATAGLAVRF